ncbi:MAG: EamA family transporter [Anaerolineaceae bacterium]
MTSKISKLGLLHLFVIYIIWGSTYLAIRVAVRDGAGFTPFAMGAMRVFLAGGLLLVWSAIRKERLGLNRPELLTMISAGILLWLLGNGLVMFGEKRADSGITALIIAGVPIWVSVIEAIWDRKLPSILLIGSLLIGAAGIVLLTLPLLKSGIKADAVSVIALLAASISWAAGTFIQSRQRIQLAPTVNSGYQMLFGGIGFIIAALALGEPLPNPIPEAWAAWGYLVVFGSIIAFTSYIQAIRLLPTNIVTTYSYVNPIIAVILGAIVLGEKITPWTIGGAALVLLGVMGAFQSYKAILKKELKAESTAVSVINAEGKT